MEIQKQIIHSERGFLFNLSLRRGALFLAVVFIVFLAIFASAYMYKQKPYFIEVTADASGIYDPGIALVKSHINVSSVSAVDASVRGEAKAIFIENVMATRMTDILASEPLIINSTVPGVPTNEYRYSRIISGTLSDINQLQPIVAEIGKIGAEVTVVIEAEDTDRAESEVRNLAYDNASIQAHEIAKQNRQYVGKLISESKVLDKSFVRPVTDNGKSRVEVNTTYLFRFQLKKSIGVFPL